MLFVSIVFSLVFAADNLAAEKKTLVKFREESWNFGRIKQGDVLTHEFIFKNEGNVPLLIEKVETTCGCTAALASANQIEPGAEGKIKASLDTRGYSGKIIKYIYVLSNDKEKSRRELFVTADIEIQPQPGIDLDRYNIDLGLSLEGDEPKAKFLIKNTGQLELKVEISHQEISFLAGGKPVSFPLKLASGKSVELELKVAPQTRTGMLRDYVLIKSNDPLRSTLSIYLSRYVITKKELKELFEKYKDIIK